MIEALRDKEFDVTQSWAYLDHATFGPLPRYHVRAAAETLERLARKGSAGLDGVALLEAVRAEAAILLHCEPRSVCLLKSTSEGLGLLAQGLDWRDGDEVVVYEQEFSGCLAPFLHLQDRGVRVRTVPDRGRNRFDLDDVEELISARTRAVCLSFVNRSHGMRAPVQAIGELCRERGIWFAVDAAQAMGVLAIDAPAIGADILAAHGYKFLFSGFGLAPTYCSDRAIEELRVPQVGWKNARIADGAVGFEAAAARYESTMSSLPVLAGTLESLRLLNSIDEAERERRAVTLIRSAAERLQTRGYELRSSPRPDEASALLAVRHPSTPAEELAPTLRSAKVACGVVDDTLRISAHFYNDEADLEALLDALPAV